MSNIISAQARISTRMSFNATI